MRKVIVANIVSADGRYEGPGGDVMALPMDGAFDAFNAHQLQHASTLLLGRRSFQLFEGYWPEVHAQPDASEDNRAISLRNNAIEKVVVSDTLTRAQTGRWADTTEIVSRERSHARVEELKRGEGEHPHLREPHGLERAARRRSRGRAALRGGRSRAGRGHAGLPGPRAAAQDRALSR